MSKISEIKEMIENAEAVLKTAKRKLSELSGNDISESSSAAGTATTPMSSMSDPNGKVIEGVFNGERMIASDGENYPIPANYASKSKLVAGDHLKLTILHDGRFLYKQIGPAPRKTIIGTLVHEDGQYKVIAEKKHYRVLLASVTYYKAEIGDKITIIVPSTEESEWAAIEAVLPGDLTDLNVHEEEPEEEVEVDF